MSSRGQILIASKKLVDSLDRLVRCVYYEDDEICAPAWEVFYKYREHKEILSRTNTRKCPVCHCVIMETYGN